MNKRQKKKFIGWTLLYGLQECEGNAYRTNICICEGNNMDELIEDYCKKNEIRLEKLKEHNGEWSDWGMPIFFCPILENTSDYRNMIEMDKGGTYPIIDTSMVTRNPFL